MIKELSLTQLYKPCENQGMATGKISVKEAARRLTSLIQEHMDEAGLSVTQRERNVRILERATPPKVAGSRGKSASPLGSVRKGRAAVSL
jgi:hypothetical protein